MVNKGRAKQALKCLQRKILWSMMMVRILRMAKKDGGRMNAEPLTYRFVD